jgi:hypothetical protein
MRAPRRQGKRTKLVMEVAGRWLTPAHDCLPHPMTAFPTPSPSPSQWGGEKGGAVANAPYNPRPGATYPTPDPSPNMGRGE